MDSYHTIQKKIQNNCICCLILVKNVDFNKVNFDSRSFEIRSVCKVHLISQVLGWRGKKQLWTAVFVMFTTEFITPRLDTLRPRLTVDCVIWPGLISIPPTTLSAGTVAGIWPAPTPISIYVKHVSSKGQNRLSILAYWLARISSSSANTNCDGLWPIHHPTR